MRRRIDTGEKGIKTTQVRFLGRGNHFSSNHPLEKCRLGVSRNFACDAESLFAPMIHRGQNGLSDCSRTWLQCSERSTAELVGCGPPDTSTRILHCQHHFTTGQDQALRTPGSFSLSKQPSHLTGKFFEPRWRMQARFSANSHPTPLVGSRNMHRIP